MEHPLKSSIDPDKVPNHIAIIMDGNGRWAKKKGRFRLFGHNQGIKTVRMTIETCRDLNIRNLTLYAFSTENWNRPQQEVHGLMKLLGKVIKDETDNLMKNDVRLRIIGDVKLLSSQLKFDLERVVEISKENKRATLTVAINYGAQQEIVRASKDIALAVANSELKPCDINLNTFEQYLYTKGLPDVDLLIRTGGEYRISNFLLWQLAYAELYFSPVLWPDFQKKHIYEAINAYQKRERRFGKTSEQLVKLS